MDVGRRPPPLTVSREHLVNFSLSYHIPKVLNETKTHKQTNTVDTTKLTSKNQWVESWVCYRLCCSHLQDGMIRFELNVAKKMNRQLYCKETVENAEEKRNKHTRTIYLLNVKMSEWTISSGCLVSDFIFYLRRRKSSSCVIIILLINYVNAIRKSIWTLYGKKHMWCDLGKSV